MLVSYAPLEPGSLGSLGIAQPTFDGGSTSFFATTSFLYTLFFVAIIGASFYRYMLAGIMRMQASDASIRQSNDVIKKTTLGLLGVFSLFLILVTFNKDLVTGDIGLGDLRAKNIQAPPIAATPPAPAAGAPIPPSTPTDTSYAARVGSHNAVVARLSSSGISTNHGNAPCSQAQFEQSTPSCTSLAYLPEESIQMILKINADCKCTLIISGGTEPGHKSHGENKRPFDLRINGSQNTSDPLYAHIKSIGTPGSSGGCFATYKYGTFTFCDERPPSNAAATWAAHFHVY